MTRPVRAALLAVFLLVAAVPPAPAQPAPLVLDDWLVLSPIPGGGRGAFSAALPFRQYHLTRPAPAPREGEAVEIVPGRRAAWQRAKGAALSGQAYYSAYCLATVRMPRAAVMVLEASGVARVAVNGDPFPGDVYRHGNFRHPVALAAGENQLLFHAVRGGLSARLVPARAAVELHLGDATLPDLVDGRPLDSWGAVPLLNAGTETVRGARLVVGDGKLLERVEVEVPPLAPLAVLKLPFPLKSTGAGLAGKSAVEAGIEVRAGGSADRAKLALRVRRLPETIRETYLSGVDGSVQYYAVRPPWPFDPGRRYSLILSLHGAGVEATGQADSYSPKPWAFVVAATNRRPFGFDWEDWGRLDALEALQAAAWRWPTDAERVYVTGHSMGGHGTWHLAVTHPDRFAAAGPSAGWISFWQYGGAANDPSPLGQLFRRATGSSDTLALAANLEPLGLYILHGDKDDNVPVGHARAMREVLGRFHKDHLAHEQPGAGHWWDGPASPGVDCVDWPPMWDLFRRRVRHRLPWRLDFRTASPGVSSSCHWVSLVSQKTAGAVSRLVASTDGAGRFAFQTENLTRFRFDPQDLAAPGKLEATVDGAKLSVDWRGGALEAARAADAWRLGPPSPDGHAKRPDRYGPFRQAFTNRFVLVYGTGGSDADRAEALARARYDSLTWDYRANGQALLVADSDFDPARFAGRNWIFYGREDTHSVWAALAARWPLRVKKGEIALGPRRFEGDGLAVLACLAHPDDHRTLIGLVGATGPSGLRLTAPYFLSGVGIPDFAIFDAGVLERGLAGVRCAGYWDEAWGLERAEIVGP